MTDLANTVLYEDVLPGGTHWSFTMKRGMTLRLIDQQGGANVGMLFYNPANLLERYNAPDTLKCQHVFKLTRGNCLYSDMGRIFCSVVEDSVGWHDTASGTCDKALVESKWGTRSYQEHRNDWTLNGRDSFLIEAAKYGLGKRDMAANVNWFSKVAVDSDGTMQFDPDNSAAGSYVDLRFEMETLVLLHTCPHPLNPAAEYPKCPVVYQFRRSAQPAADDVCRTFCAENQRGFKNNELYHLQG
ncbi:MAG: urea carboxylase [Desulfuromonas sp.]|nr:MAG: urea carboxylase [Desulfuromonas sp.]